MLENSLKTRELIDRGQGPLMSKNKQLLIIYFFLAAITLTAFRQVGNHGFVNFDDNSYIVENPNIQDGLTTRGLGWAFTTAYSANWHPLTWISHMLDIQFFGLNPHWHHLTNLLFHIANVLLLFFVLHRMTKAPWQSAFTAALFALHPLHVESVAWIAERKDVLSTFFWMLTLIAYSYYAAGPRTKSYIAVVALFALGLMAKPMLVTLPFVLLLLDYWPLERFQQASIRLLVLEKIPLFALSALSCIATYIAQKQGGALAPTKLYSPDIRIPNAIVSYFIYIAKTIWPDNLAVFYPHPGVLPVWQVLGAVLFLAAITYAVLRTAKSRAYLPVGWLWFTGTLVPVIGFVQVGGQALADRYTYIPSIGLFIMAAWGIPEILKKYRYGKYVLAASSALCLICFFLITRTQVGYWHDAITLSDHALNVTKDNYYMHLLRGMAEYRLGNYGQAIEDYSRAIESEPENEKAYFHRGHAFIAMGDYTRAVEDFNEAIKINPGSAQYFNTRGSCYVEMGDNTRALEDFNRAVGSDPDYAQAYFNRGTLYQNSGKYRQAVDEYDKAIESGYPRKEEALCSRGSAYGNLGDPLKAVQDFNKALEINPQYAQAYYNRGYIYQNSGKYRLAADDYEKAIRTGYGVQEEVFCNLGAVYGNLGKHAMALEYYERALAVNPEYAPAYYNRAVDYFALGKQIQAVHDFDRAIQINPEHAGAYYLRGKVHAILGDQALALEDMKAAARLGFEDARKFLKTQGVDW